MLDWEECVQSLKCAFHKGQYPTGGYEFLWLVRTFLVPGPWCQPDAHTHVLPNSFCSKLFVSSACLAPHEARDEGARH